MGAKTTSESKLTNKCNVVFILATGCFVHAGIACNAWFWVLHALLNQYMFHNFLVSIHVSGEFTVLL